MWRTMGNTESVVVQKRLSRFRPEDRPVIQGVFDRLQGNVPAGAQKKTPAGNTLTFEMLQVVWSIWNGKKKENVDLYSYLPPPKKKRFTEYSYMR